MLHSHCHNHHHHHHLLFPNLPVPLSLGRHHYLPLRFLQRHKTLHIISAIPVATSPWLSHLGQLTTGTIELPISPPFILTTTHDPSIVDVTSGILFTGATAAFFFRSILSQVKRAKELKFRSSEVKKSSDSLKATKSNSIKAKAPPTPDQALLGAIIAGVIAVFLYNLITTIETAFSRQTVLDNFLVRQFTITIRTMISGLCYLATFIYGFSSIGLLLYSGQLAIESFMGGSIGKQTENKITEHSGSPNSSDESLTSENKLCTMKEDQSPNKLQ